VRHVGPPPHRPCLATNGTRWTRSAARLAELRRTSGGPGVERWLNRNSAGRPVVRMDAQPSGSRSHAATYTKMSTPRPRMVPSTTSRRTTFAPGRNTSRCRRTPRPDACRHGCGSAASPAAAPGGQGFWARGPGWSGRQSKKSCPPSSARQRRVSIGRRPETSRSPASWCLGVVVGHPMSVQGPLGH
jgi:hypothetical protein